MKKQILILLIAFLSINLVLVSWGIVTYLVTIPTNGTVNVQGLQASPESISWGLMDPGATHGVNVDLTNNGTAPLILNMTYGNVVGLTNFSLSWNREGYSLGSTQVVTAMFSLTIFEYSQTDFSFDIYVNDQGL